VMIWFISVDTLPKEQICGFSSRPVCASAEYSQRCLVSVDTGTFIRSHSTLESRFMRQLFMVFVL